MECQEGGTKEGLLEEVTLEKEQHLNRLKMQKRKGRVVQVERPRLGRQGVCLNAPAKD